MFGIKQDDLIEKKLKDLNRQNKAEHIVSFKLIVLTANFFFFDQTKLHYSFLSANSIQGGHTR